MLVAKRCRVVGRVQGVYYRASARQEALRLGIVGYARNLSDGSVEVLAMGDSAQVNDFIAWLWKGSPASSVTQVAVAEAAFDPAVTEFRTN